ncbi:hypothetical protein LJB81_00535 [Desulfovibrio sp. OttesenSCG-928-M14]|nr:hypothetical protein [Desulfovibrio sp. OttesenSCG-928-M14]
MRIFSFIAIVIASIAFASNGIAASQSKCPDKVIEKDTIQGIYMGIECGGSMCCATIILQSGEEFTLTCGEDEAEKFFGKGTGQFVEVEYELQQFWSEEYDDCLRTEVAVSGKRLDNNSSPASAAPQNSTPDTYTYQEEGFAGELLLTRLPGNTKFVEVVINTINKRSNHTCSFEGPCVVLDGVIYCPEDSDNEHCQENDCIVRIKDMGDILEVLPSSRMWCGMSGYMLGRYVKK